MLVLLLLVSFQLIVFCDYVDIFWPVLYSTLSCEFGFVLKFNFVLLFAYVSVVVKLYYMLYMFCTNLYMFFEIIHLQICNIASIEKFAFHLVSNFVRVLQRIWYRTNHSRTIVMGCYHI